MKPYQKLLDYVREIIDLESAVTLADWDQNTHMPPSGAEARARMVATLSKEIHRKTVDPRLRDLAHDVLSMVSEEESFERDVARFWLKEHEEALMVPEALQAELAEASSLCCSAWIDGVNYSGLLPQLTRVVDLSRSWAACFTGSKPYDALIDAFEPGITQHYLDRIFATLRPAIENLRNNTAPRPCPTPLAYSKEDFFDIATDIVTWMGYDSDRGNLSDTEHPFMSSMGPNDVRIATYRDHKDVVSRLAATIHEAGHAIYEQNTPREYAEAGLGPRSSALHESQSLFYEMAFGHKRVFWEGLVDLTSSARLREQGITPQYILDTLNSFDPTNRIRLQASDVDYGLHIILRYEVEKQLFTHNLPVSDMRECFNELSRQYFGRAPDDDRIEGFLQDVHWPAGLFGYFPSYLLGAVFAFQLWDSIGSDKSPGTILNFLGHNVHRHGGRLNFKEVTGALGGLDIKPYLAGIATPV